MESKIEKIEIAQEREELFREMINEGKLTLKDSRRHFKGNFKYSLEEILFLWLCARACGFYSYRRIELYATLKINYIVSAFDTAQGITLLQEKVPDKSNEIMP